MVTTLYQWAVLSRAMVNQAILGEPLVSGMYIRSHWQQLNLIPSRQPIVR
jgi:acyl dehydratase